MTDDFDPPIDADLDSSGRDLILMFAEDRVFLAEVLDGLGLPDIDAVWSRMRSRRLIGESYPQTRKRDEVFAELKRREAEIDERYRDVPIEWNGPLDTDAQIAEAAITMQREIEGDTDRRLDVARFLNLPPASPILASGDFPTFAGLTDAIDEARATQVEFAVLFADGVVAHYRRDGDAWIRTRRQMKRRRPTRSRRSHSGETSNSRVDE